MNNQNGYVRKVTVTGEASSYYVTLPKRIVRNLDWRKGTIVHIRQRGRSIIIQNNKSQITNK